MRNLYRLRWSATSAIRLLKLSSFLPVALVFALIAGLATPISAFAETDTEYWNHSNERNNQQINHQQWQSILDRYLVNSDSSPVNLFRYSEVTNDDKNLLNSYISSMQKIDPRLYSKSQQKSYWINLYNALTVKLIIDNYPVKSITKLGDSIFGFGPWDDDAVIVGSKMLSLNDIEHKILRPIWQDPRIHYAVNCASYSCPNLSSQAFSPQNIERLLEQGAYDYINHPRGVTIEGDTLLLSSIYKWYLKDFGNNQANLFKHLNHYAEPALKQQLQAFKNDASDIDYDYDWRLNEVK